MDQIFERLERLVKSWVGATADGGGFPGATAARPRSGLTGDMDLDEAMAELDDFLSPDKTETERREEAARRDREAREKRERDARARAGGQNGRMDEKAAVSEAYRFLGLPMNAPFAQVKTAYKKLLLKNHPDRNSQTPDSLKHSTEISARINAAYQLIEAWVDAGKGPR